MAACKLDPACFLFWPFFRCEIFTSYWFHGCSPIPVNISLWMNCIYVKDENESTQVRLHRHCWCCTRSEMRLCLLWLVQAPLKSLGSIPKLCKLLACVCYPTSLVVKAKTVKDMTEALFGLATIWFHPKEKAIILPLSQLRERGFQSIQSLGRKEFDLTTNGTTRMFWKSVPGLYYLATDDNNGTATILVNMASDIKRRPGHIWQNSFRIELVIQEPNPVHHSWNIATNQSLSRCCIKHGHGIMSSKEGSSNVHWAKTVNTKSMVLKWQSNKTQATIKYFY